MPMYPATLIVHTVTGAEPCCEKHAKKLADLMRFLGVCVTTTPTTVTVECNNCRNAAAKQETP